MKKDLILQAIEAYYEACRTGMIIKDCKGNEYTMLVYQQPSESDSIIGWKYVHLRNCNSEIARYNIKTEEITV